MRNCSLLLILGVCSIPSAMVIVDSEHGTRDFYETDFEISKIEAVWEPRLVGEPKVIIHRNLTPSDAAPNLESNNNVAAFLHQDRLFVAWRTSPLHFASADTQLHLVSSVDNGESWDLETTVFTGNDLREPLFFEAGEDLYFSFFEAGTNIVQFEPKGLFRMKRKGLAQWTQPQIYGHKGEVIWDIVKENGTQYSQSYSGNYSVTAGGAQDLGQLLLFLNRSDDGLTWTPVGQETIYQGGITEVGLHFDLEGNLWGVGRNEDGDESGWGSRTFFASASDLSDIQFLHEESNPWIYESPRMFRHGSELFLVARTDPDGPFWTRDDIILNALPPWEHHAYDLVSFSFRQHGTAIWRLNMETGGLEKVVDLVGCGDTAFPSIIRTGDHTFVIFNYSSSVNPDNCPPNWLMGQVSPAGSLIYMQEIEFVELVQKI